MSIIFYGDYSDEQLISCLTEKMREDTFYWRNKVIPIVSELKRSFSKLPKHIDIIGHNDICNDGTNLSVILFRCTFAV